ncbi:Imm1 family immunity protein [Kitasatospora sp. NPDC085879]|uniref:Imm1 family immunity protein n=1 Tax=Kitasatospora sp. NPDC085879 TaxID=3154769 RepID=UPI00341C84BB
MLNRIEAFFRADRDEKPLLIDSPEGVDALIDELLNGHPFCNMAQLRSLDQPLHPGGFPERALLAGVDRNARVGIVAFSGEEGSFVPAGAAGKDCVTYMIATYPREFLDSPEISIDLVRQAVKEFLLSGGLRPTCIEWQEEPF